MSLEPRKLTVAEEHQRTLDQLEARDSESPAAKALAEVEESAEMALAEPEVVEVPAKAAGREADMGLYL